MLNLVDKTKLPFEQRFCQFCFQNDNVRVVECDFHVFSVVKGLMA